jgi:hypothetical protein
MFKKWTHIISKEAGKYLPEYTHGHDTIALRTGNKLPWGSSYIPSEPELEVHRE